MTDDNLARRGKEVSQRLSAEARAKGQEQVPDSEGWDDPVPEPPDSGLSPDSDRTLDDLRAWFGRFVRVSDDGDLDILTLWTVHTHLVNETRTSPRLLLDSLLPGSGKTTVLDHLSRLCFSPVQAASLSSPALLARLLANEPRCLLIDEADRSLRPDKPTTADMIAHINSGYRVGASRPVLVPTKGGNWVAEEMSTYGPVALAGRSPALPDDTMSRCIRILLMPDLDGEIEDSDWEFIEAEAKVLRTAIEKFAQENADTVRTAGVDLLDLPTGCIGRSKEKWRPMMRIAVAAGGEWPNVCRKLIDRSIEEDAAERDAGLRNQPPALVLLQDLWAIWPTGEDFIASSRLTDMLVVTHPEYWGPASPYGKRLTEKRLGILLSSGGKVTSRRESAYGPRGYYRTAIEPIWSRMGITTPNESGSSGSCGQSGSK